MTEDKTPVGWSGFWAAFALAMICIVLGVVAEQFIHHTSLFAKAGATLAALFGLAAMYGYIRAQPNGDEFERRIDLIGTVNGAMFTIGFIIVHALISRTGLTVVVEPFSIFAMPGQFILFKAITRLTLDRALAKGTSGKALDALRQ